MHTIPISTGKKKTKENIFFFQSFKPNSINLSKKKTKNKKQQQQNIKRKKKRRKHKQLGSLGKKKCR